MPGLFDHAFVVLFAVIFPLVGFLQHRQFVESSNRGHGSRSREYLWTMAIQWMLALLGVGIWITSDRSWPALGFGFEIGTAFWICAGLAGLAVVVQVLQVKRVKDADPETIRQARESLGDLGAFLPHTKSELQVGNLLSVTAGIVEQTLWRGFLVWYLTFLMPLWAAAIVAVAIFGLGHIYQGTAGVLKTGGMGGILMGLFLASGSLWISIILHILTDMFQLRAAYEVLKFDPEDGVAGSPSVA